MASFFRSPQAAAVLKHGLLSRYLPIFATKTGSVAGEVVYLDAYAGPGLYNDGTPGSPALALRIGDVVAGYQGKATLHGHLIEKNRTSYLKLAGLLSSRGAAWDLHHGLAEEHLPGILESLDDDTPLFSFLDPFGLPIPFAMVEDILKHGRNRYGVGPATEVLLNFSIPGISRMAGQLTGTFHAPARIKAAATMVDRLDAVLGGDWWHPIQRSGAPDRYAQIREGYKERLLAVGPNWSLFDIPVSDRWEGSPSYHMLFMTQHRDGVWSFHEVLSSAMEKYREYCHATEGLLDLDPDRETQWVSAIAANIEGILAAGKGFRPMNRIVDVYGDTFAQAREKHVRKSLKALHAAGKTPTNCVGEKIPKLLIQPPP